MPAELADRVYLSPAEVGRFVPWDRGQVTRRIRQGTLRGQKFGGEWLVDASAFWAQLGLREPERAPVDPEEWRDDVARLASELVDV